MLRIVDRLEAAERKQFIGAIAETLLSICNPILMEHPELDVDGLVHKDRRRKPQ